MQSDNEGYDAGSEKDKNNTSTRPLLRTPTKTTSRYSYFYRKYIGYGAGVSFIQWAASAPLALKSTPSDLNTLWNIVATCSTLVQFFSLAMACFICSQNSNYRHPKVYTSVIVINLAILALSVACYVDHTNTNSTPTQYLRQ